MRTSTNHRQLLLLVSAALLAACNERPPEYGVSVFSTDTLPVVFTLSLTGSLALGMRSEGFKMRPDKSLVLTTPAELIWSRGDGTARIETVRGGRIVVQPLGVTDSAADTTAAVGYVVLLVKPPERRLVKLSVEKP